MPHPRDIVFGDVPPPVPWPDVPPAILAAYMRDGVPEAFAEYERRWAVASDGGTAAPPPP